MTTAPPRGKSKSPLTRYPNLRDMLGAAPEQAVLNLALGLKNRRLRLVADVRPDREFLVCGPRLADREVPVVNGVPVKNNKLVLAAKWPGDYHSGRRAFVGESLHRPHANRALARVRSADVGLHDSLASAYEVMYGAPAESRATISSQAQ